MAKLEVGGRGISIVLPRTVSGICASGGVFAIILGATLFPDPTTILVGFVLVFLGGVMYLATGK